MVISEVRGDCVLVVNAGSSSLKLSRFRIRDHDLELAQHADVEAPDGAGCDDTWVSQLVDDAIVAVGHRVVHGGTDFTAPTLVDDRVYAELKRLVPLAPLHQPRNLAPIRAVRAARPALPQVACFDTAFHRTHPLLADVYALPWRWYDAGIRRYGFHGLSYEYVAATLPDVAP